MVRRAHASSSFKKMKQQYEPGQMGGNPGHFRKGGVGDWRSHFNRRQSEKFDATHTSKLAGAPELRAKYDFGPKGMAW